jgi:hypothetical protein
MDKLGYNSIQISLKLIKGKFFINGAKQSKEKTVEATGSPMIFMLFE